KKYPKMFLTTDLMLVSKSDLLPYLPFTLEAVTKDALEVNHELEVIQLSALTDEGIDEWCDWLLEKIYDKRGF
ncbi:MAG: hydrogenase accessory protein HypB, partial [Bacteroidota bacterium]